MASGGEIDRNALIESFTRIKQDIAKLNSDNAKLSEEIYELKLSLKKTIEENLELKKSSPGIDKSMIAEIVKETISKMQQKKPAANDILLRRINKSRKSILKNRIHSLAEQKSLTLPEIKDTIVDREGLCSKATFYRYIEKMKEKGLIDLIKINDSDVVVRVN